MPGRCHFGTAPEVLLSPGDWTERRRFCWCQPGFGLSAPTLLTVRSVTACCTSSERAWPGCRRQRLTTRWLADHLHVTERTVHRWDGPAASCDDDDAVWLRELIAGDTARSGCGASGPDGEEWRRVASRVIASATS